MKLTETKKLAKYLFDNFAGNFIGFMIGIASTRLVSHFFATRSIKNLWGLTSRKTVIDKSTFSNLEWGISVVIGFIVFEIISKAVKKKMEVWVPKYKESFIQWMGKNRLYTNARNADL
jgi:hypothetical protein